MMSTLYLNNTLRWIFIVLAHWNNSPRVDMSPYSDTLSWFRANQSLLFLLSAASLAEKQQIPINHFIIIILLQEMVDGADRDRDGLVSKQEFLRILRTEQN